MWRSLFVLTVVYECVACTHLHHRKGYADLLSGLPYAAHAVPLVVDVLGAAARLLMVRRCPRGSGHPLVLFQHADHAARVRAAHGGDQDCRLRGAAVPQGMLASLLGLLNRWSMAAAAGAAFDGAADGGRLRGSGLWQPPSAAVLNGDAAAVPVGDVAAPSAVAASATSPLARAAEAVPPLLTPLGTEASGRASVSQLGSPRLGRTGSALRPASAVFGGSGHRDRSDSTASNLSALLVPRSRAGSVAASVAAGANAAPLTADEAQAALKASCAWPLPGDGRSALLLLLQIVAILIDSTPRAGG